MKIKVAINSRANHVSKNEETVDVEDIGYTESEWRALDEEAQMKAVTAYWHDQGLPEISFSEVE